MFPNLRLYLCATVMGTRLGGRAYSLDIALTSYQCSHAAASEDARCCPFRDIAAQGGSERSGREQIMLKNKITFIYLNS